MGVVLGVLLLVAYTYDTNGNVILGVTGIAVLCLSIGYQMGKLGKTSGKQG